MMADCFISSYVFKKNFFLRERGHKLGGAEEERES